METIAPMTSKAIALAEKKMDMTLDDIIKMSKKSASKAGGPRASASLFNKTRRFPNSGSSQGISSKVQRLMESRSSRRQGFLAQRRSNLQGNQFPVAREAARKASAAPIHNGPLCRNRVANWNRQRYRGAAIRNVSASRFADRVKKAQKQSPQTLDALFANMKEQRMRQEQLMVMHHGKKVGRPRGQVLAKQRKSRQPNGACELYHF